MVQLKQIDDGHGPAIGVLIQAGMQPAGDVQTGHNQAVQPSGRAGAGCPADQQDALAFERGLQGGHGTDLSG